MASKVEKTVDELLAALDAKDEERVVAAGIILLKGFLVNVERVATALEKAHFSPQDMTGSPVTSDDIGTMIAKAAKKTK